METPLSKFIKLMVKLHELVSDEEINGLDTEKEADDIRDQMDEYYYKLCTQEDIERVGEISGALNAERDRINAKEE